MRVFPLASCAVFLLACQLSWAQSKPSAKPSTPVKASARKPPVAPKTEPKKPSFFDGTYASYDDNSAQGAGFYIAQNYTVSGDQIKGTCTRKNEFGEHTWGFVGAVRPSPPDSIGGQVAFVVGIVLVNPDDVKFGYKSDVVVIPKPGGDEQIAGGIFKQEDGYHLIMSRTFTEINISGTKIDNKKPNDVGRTFFYISYLNYEKGTKSKYQTFPDAAQTWEEEVKKEYDFQEGKDKFIEAYARSPSDFEKTWLDIYNSVKESDQVIVLGAVFSHASIPLTLHGWQWETGLEFGVETTEGETGSTLTQERIEKLPVMDWAFDAELLLFGCNTGRLRTQSIKNAFEKNWCPASEFSKDQNVKVTGEMGFSYFSKSPTEYIEIPDKIDKAMKIYLRAFARGKNTAIGEGIDGHRIPTKSFP